MTYDNPDSVREQHLADTRWESTRRRHRFFATSIVILLLAVAGLAWITFPELQRHNLSLAQLPVVQQSVLAMGDQLRASDASVADWSARQEDLRGKVDKTTRDLRNRIEAARKQAGEATVAMFERVQSQLANQIDGVKTRLAKLESSSESDQARIASLQRELTQVRGEMAAQAGQFSQQLASVRSQVDQNASASERQTASLQETRLRDRRDFDALDHRIAMKRVDFEVTKKHSRQLAPGISLGVDGTDVSGQRVNGWLWFMPEKKTVWLRQQRIQDPVVVSSTEDGRQREVVLTRVSKNSVVGYVVLPAEADAFTTTVASAGQ
jgi:hypothetical protein